MQAKPFVIGGNEHIAIDLPLAMANRHGLVSGATGTGKTVTLQRLAEGFSLAGVPVFMSDVKGDLSGLVKPIVSNDKIQARVDTLKLTDYQPRGFPALLWDIYGEQGHPVRATISDMGPLLLASLLQLNETQTGVLYAAFKIADDEGLLLLDMKDLRAMLSWIADNAKTLSRDYGSMSGASIAAIQRRLMVLEQQGADHFFGEPAIELQDIMQTDFSGNGVISILDATRLMHEPRLYAMFLLWLISELFEQLPEVGDVDKPRLVFFFDEAHLLFDDAPAALLDKIEQVVRLIRSKGVGIFFVTQNPLDVPDTVLGQLGNRVQHALRAFTPRDQKAVRAAAQTFRTNPKLDTEQVITELGVGEALVSVLNAKGQPTPVERVLIGPPASRIGPITPQERAEHQQRSPLGHRYDELLDRQSAYELLKIRTENLAFEQARQAMDKPQRRSTRQTPAEAMVKSAARSFGNQLGRQLVRGLLGSFRGKG